MDLREREREGGRERKRGYSTIFFSTSFYNFDLTK
jgi:hypothetical protein